MVITKLEGVIPPYDELAGYDHNHACLSAKVRQWAGLQSSWGSFGAGELARKNDEDATFSEIAEIIASEPEGLFVRLPDDNPWFPKPCLDPSHNFPSHWCPQPGVYQNICPSCGHISTVSVPAIMC